MKSVVSNHKYYIPKNYYEPAMFALRLFREKDISFNKAVDIAHRAFTSDPSAEGYVPPAKLVRNTLSKHILKYIANDY